MVINSNNRKGLPNRLLSCLSFILFFFLFTKSFAAGPVNDNCTSATVIAIPTAGYGLGTFTSAPTDLTSATVQTGETFAPAIFVAALDKKSVWYKFSIPTIRAVRVTLTQPGTTITAGDVGFAVYKADSCLPGNADISSKLTPIVTFGNTYHPCVPSGEYLIQVSSNLNAKGPITVQVEISDQTGAAYDHPNQAYAFGQVKYYAQKIDFNTECQSIEDASEVCTAFSNKTDYNKTAWLTFKTPAYFDYIAVQLSGTGTSSYFPSNNNQAVKRSFGYTLYKGDAVTTPIKSLTTVEGCDSLATDGYYAAYRMYKCSDLQPNTTYSIQLFIKKDFGDDVRLGILAGGQGPTNAPKPIVSAVPAPNAIGNLSASPNGTLTTVYDVWGCNSRHSNAACGPSLPDSGIKYNGGRYNLSSFFTFTLTTTCAIYFNSYVTQCGPQPLLRVYKQGLTNDCTNLDTANIIGVFNYNGTIDCLPPGNYTVQVSGQDPTDWYGRFTYGTPTYNAEQCLSNNLGTTFRLDMTAYTRKAANKYALNVKGAFDSINRVGNVMQPLKPNIAYPAVSDTMGCLNTLRPADTTCSPVNNKVMYREFVVADSGVVDFSNLTTSPNSTPWRYRLYSGDANALASAQSVFAFPDKVTGLIPRTECFDGYAYCANKTACVLPGTYTFTTMGGDGDVGRVDAPVFTFVKTRTNHYSPLTAQDMGSIMDTLGAAGGTLKSDVDDWSCSDNAVPINGFIPCNVGGKPATKAIYRQFYLKSSALVRIDNQYYYYCAGRAFGTRTLFYGKATNGLAGLTPVGGGWSCFQTAGTTNGCDLLPEGWYTVVSYNQGPSYDSTFRSLNLEGRYNSSVAYHDEFNITITPTCPGPKFNRPHKASIDTSTKQPFLITWGNRVTGSAVYPKKDSLYVLPTENFNCIVDTPFAKHPVNSCEPSLNRVAYYVFKTTQPSFLEINAGGYYAALYNKDVRIDSAQFGTLTPLQPCSNTAGFIQFCQFEPGTYTLVIFASNANVCGKVTPSIHIDEIGYSRFDFAKNAYDFGILPPDSTYHYGKVGEVNPLNSNRKPSSDFFYCTTGASNTDPTEPVCNTTVNPNVYNTGLNKPLYDSAFPPSRGITRRNLWYTFVVNEPGYVKVKVESKTPAREYQQKFAVYQSHVDGTLPFSTLVSSGRIDSTAAQGLQFIGTNPWYYPYNCANLGNEVSFYRDPCTSVTTRYYVLVENVNSEPYENGGTLPNTQTEVSVLIDSVNLVLPKHDHYSLAGNIGQVGVGTYTGDTDNYSCATKDLTDPVYYYNNSSNCQKTLWYKFTATITGNVRYRIHVKGVTKQDYYDVQLFRQIIPNDSTVKGLQIIGYSGVYGTDNTYWAQTCVSPGTYYLLLPGCDQVGDNVYPEIELIEATGDFCSRPVTAVLNGAGSVSASVLVDCHTIGTDYGEFGPQLTCPQGANTADYKSSWFRMNIGGKDTLDVTTYLVENTNASSSDIKYRLMTGDCGAMQEQSCVLDALTRNTYQCLAPGQSYYIQVFTPITKFNQQVTGTIDLKLSAIAHKDTCAPLTNCLANSNFTKLFDCNKDDSVKFVNFSTYGTSITYKWDFGYNGQTSTAVSPSFFYPALPVDQTYDVKLVVQNNSCGRKDSIIKTITVPGRPYIKLGNDSARCNGAPLTLKATSYASATYLWNDGSKADTLLVTAPGSNDYWVKINYNGCSSTDTIKVLISSISSKPLQNIIVCTDSVSVSVNRGLGETYKWSNGSASSFIYVSKPGYYWADIKYSTCTYRDSFFVNNAATATPLGNDRTVCFSSGKYTLNARTAGAVSYTWQDGSSADSFNVTAPGKYSVTINFGSCIIKDTVNISGLPTPVVRNVDTTICFGQSLILPWGKTVNVAGVYRDTVRYVSGCDSMITKVTLSKYPQPDIGSDTTLCLAQSPYILNATTSQAVSYRWQDASTKATYSVTAPGLYWVIINFGSCNSRDSIKISGSAAPATKITDTSICFASSLTLPWGMKITAAGTYRDTIHSFLGCDSIIRVVNLTVKPKPVLGNDTTVFICGSSTAGFKLPSGQVIYSQGVYKDTLQGKAGCDSLITTYTLRVTPVTKVNKNISLCSGQTYTLPSGLIVNSAGVYVDTLRNAGGCDSLITTVNLKINSPVSTGSSAIICAGQTYTLPSGNKVNVSGIYKDTVKSVAGCDSLITTVSLTVYVTKRIVTNATVCDGKPYTLPSGAIVNTTGVYKDILKSVYGCDSLTTTVNLTVYTAQAVNSTVSICAGQTYKLPSGITVNKAGIYKDTVKNVSGCDSLISSVTLSVVSATLNNINTTICKGADYKLPSGKLATTSGRYLDTIRNTMGCDSLLYTVNLTVLAAAVVNKNITICAEQTYKLASGQLINSQGVYKDTLRNTSGCDSLITTINLTVQNAIIRSSNVSICSAQTYTLPSGKIVNTSGTYVDTIKSILGCDSVVRSVILTVFTPGLANINASVCAGQAYKLPSGRSVTASGIYKDTLRAVAACDSFITTVNLQVLTVSFVNKKATVCQGDFYTLPSGKTVSNTGIYKDTLHNQSGCDSIITTVDLVVKPVVQLSTNVVVCSGQSFTLPSGAIVNTSGVYRDTVRYVTGCDSLIRTINLTVIPYRSVNIAQEICAGESYMLPSGRNVNATGIYRDTLKSYMGCDSVLAVVNLTVNPRPSLTIAKSNDVDCILGTAQLTALGAGKYLWSPASSLNNTNISNPVASPAATTVYKLQATSNKGCVSEDSIEVKVITGDIQNGYLVASAFTPNGDGLNDCFGVKTWGNISNLEFAVYDRLGFRVFYTQNPSKCWDGTNAGVQLGPATFVYQISANTICGRVFRKGTVVLIR